MTNKLAEWMDLRSGTRVLDVGCGSVESLVGFFPIPAQSASLFPKQPYEERAKSVKSLFETLNPWKESMTIGWDMAKAVKKL